MAETPVIRADIAGVRVALLPGHPELAEYARTHLETAAACAGGPVQITASLRWREGPQPPGRDGDLSRWERLDRDLYRDGAAIAWYRVEDFRDLALRARLAEGALRVAGEYGYRLAGTAARDRLKRLLYRRRVAELRRRRFTTLLYYLVYYPAFWWHERYEGYHPVHAGGVELDGRVVLLAGPSGVGKSTLCVALGAEPGGRLLGDTFVLHDGPRARPVREPLLIDGAARRWLGPRAGILERIDFRYCLGRDGFAWKPERSSPGGEVALLLFPSRSPEPYLRPLSPQEAAARMSSSNLLVNDLRRYWAFAAAFDFLDPARLVQQREESVSRLVAEVPAYAIGLGRERTAEQVVAEVCDLVARSAPARASG